MSYGYYPLQLICFIMIFLYFLRYFAIIGLNEDKNALSKAIIRNGDCDITGIIKFRVYCLKMIAKPYLTIGMIILAYFFFFGVFTIVLASTGFVCKFGTLIGLKVVNNVFLIVIYVMTIMLFVIDLFRNVKLIAACKIYQYILGSDPYYFRFQICLFVPFMLFSLASELYILSSSLTFVSIIINFRKHMVFNTVMCAILLIIEVLFPLVMTIFEMGVSIYRSKQRVDPSAYTKLLQDPVIEELFMDFARKEYSVENYLCYKDIQSFKRRSGDAEEIYETYLNGGASVLEVNCSHESKSKITEQLNAYKKIREIAPQKLSPRKSTNLRKSLRKSLKGSNHLQDNLFEPLELELIGNIGDTWNRFRFTGKYLAYKQLTVTLSTELSESPRTIPIN